MGNRKGLSRILILEYKEVFQKDEFSKMQALLIYLLKNCRSGIQNCRSRFFKRRRMDVMHASIYILT